MFLVSKYVAGKLLKVWKKCIEKSPRKIRPRYRSVEFCSSISKSSYLWSFFMSEKINIHVNFFKSHTIYIEKQVFIYVLSRYILCSINSVTYLVLCKTMSKICKSSQQAILSFLFLKGILFFYYPILYLCYSTNEMTCPQGFCMSNFKMPDFFMGNNFSYHYYQRTCHTRSLMIYNFFNFHQCSKTFQMRLQLI